MLGKQMIEMREVTSFLIVHVLHQRAKMRMGLDNGWRLGGIDAGGGQFAGVIYSKSSGEKVFLLLGERATSLRVGGMETFRFGLGRWRCRRGCDRFRPISSNALEDIWGYATLEG